VKERIHPSTIAFCHKKADTSLGYVGENVSAL
jgi:hypothetical protein